MKNMKGSALLLLAAIVWGMAFVAQSAAADSIGGFTFNATRSILASLFLLAVMGIRKLIPGKGNENTTGTLKGGILCGILLFAAVNFQQFGIAAYPENTAASGRAGFITATYVVMVAVAQRFTGKKLKPTVLAAVLGCIAGMYMLCLSGGISKVYTGDLLVLLCSVMFTAYIMVVDRFSGADGIALSCIQFLVCGVLSAIPMFIFEKPEISAISEAWLPIMYAGIFSSGIGYTLQIIGQKYAEPAVASIVMSLESVFAALAGWLILSERLSPRELFGCGLVFASVILAQLPGFRVKKSGEKAEIK